MMDLCDYETCLQVCLQPKTCTRSYSRAAATHVLDLCVSGRLLVFLKNTRQLSNPRSVKEPFLHVYGTFMRVAACPVGCSSHSTHALLGSYT